MRLSGKVSSQYLSAFLMASPLALGDVEIVMIDKLVSVPYVDMTLQLMARFGVTVPLTGMVAGSGSLSRGGELTSAYCDPF